MLARLRRLHVNIRSTFLSFWAHLATIYMFRLCLTTDAPSQCPACYYWDEVATGCHPCDSVCDFPFSEMRDCDALCPGYDDVCADGSKPESGTGAHPATKPPLKDGSTTTGKASKAIKSYIHVAFWVMAALGFVIIFLAIGLAIRWRKKLGCRAGREGEGENEGPQGPNRQGPRQQGGQDQIEEEIPLQEMTLNTSVKNGRDRGSTPRSDSSSVPESERQPLST